MKKIVLIITLIFVSLGLFCQIQQKVQTNIMYNEVTEIFNTTQIHVDRTGVMYDWRLSNPACNGCGSFYYAITRTLSPDDLGRYYFYLLIQSNSYYGNGVLATTYIKGFNMDVSLSDGSQVHVIGPLESILIEPSKMLGDLPKYVAHVWSTETDIVIYVDWTSVQAF